MNQAIKLASMHAIYFYAHADILAKFGGIRDIKVSMKSGEHVGGQIIDIKASIESGNHAGHVCPVKGPEAQRRGRRPPRVAKGTQTALRRS